jgi:hypothetical protein
MGKENITWTDDEVEQFKRLHAAGDSFGLIGSQIGKSRNACISKARRLGLPMRVVTRSLRPEKKPRPPKQNRPHLTICRASGNSNKLRLIETVKADLPTFTCDVVPLNKTLDDVGSGCRYIGGDPIADHPGIYCGHPVYKRSYCAAHFVRCYVEPAQRWGGASPKAHSIHQKIVPVDSGNLSDADQAGADLALASEPELA